MSITRIRNSLMGFFAGEGHRTPIPNSFFDSVVKTEALSVVKVVGAVLRHTVGYQNQFGGRRQVAPLSYSYILEYTNLSDRTTLSQAIQHAIATGYIRCVQKGGIDSQTSKRRPSMYAVRWHEQANSKGNGSKTRPINQQRYKNQTDNGSKSRPVAQFKNQTEEMPHQNNTNKQQIVFSDSVVVENLESLKLLQEAGFDEDVALELSQKRGLQEIQQQIEWLPHRNAERNSLGMLRKAIQGDWLKPDAIITTEKKQQRAENDQKQATQAEMDDARVSDTKQEKKRRREQLLPVWNNLVLVERDKIERETFAQLNSDFLRERFQKNEEFRLNQCLDVFGNFTNQQQDAIASKKNSDTD